MEPRETTADGLSAAEVAERVARGEVNRVRATGRAEYLDIALRNTLTLFNALVVPAAAALFSLGDWRAGLAVSGMALTNTALGLAQEVRAKRHLDRLSLLAETPVRVVRDGAAREVRSGDVVRGDLVLLAAGDPVIADGAVREARFLEVDEALLTGESDPVPRRPGERVLSGSFCVAGEGSFVAEQVGAAALARRTEAEARAYRHIAGPLRRVIDRLIRILTTTAVLLCLGYVLLYRVGDVSEEQLVRMVAATVTLMVPQGLVLMATLALILGAVRLARRGAVVRRLDAVETMAAVDTLCLDKTGTLTTNRLHLERLEVVAGEEPATVRDRLRRFAHVSADKGSKTVAALRDALGVSSGEAELLDFLPFKSQNRYSAARVRSGGAGHVLVLGACEALRPVVASTAAGTWEASWHELQGTGLRLLLFAEAVSGPGKFAGSLEGFVLRPLALVGLADELRPEAGGVLAELAGQGLGVKVLSGDHAETVRAAVAPLAGRSPELRGLTEQPVVTGKELEESPGREALVGGRAVFARVTPWQKVEVVRALQATGRHVAMVGDGVNDVLALKQADLGVAMGAGSRAARTVAGLVLEGNDFGLLPRTLMEGRTVVRNLRRVGKIFLTKNGYALPLIVGALALLHLPFPFLPQQVTLLDFLTIGVPALLVMLGRTPGPSSPRSDFLAEVGAFALWSGGVIGAAGLLVYWLSARSWGDDEVTQRTMLLSTLVPLGLATVLRVLAEGGQGRTAGDRTLRLAVAAGMAVYLATMYVPAAADFFVLKPLGVWPWARVLAITVPACAVLLAGDYLAARIFTATSAATTRGG
jgi:cation-transporting ATPase E